jgi:hypothetical protein
MKDIFCTYLRKKPKLSYFSSMDKWINVNNNIDNSFLKTCGRKPDNYAYELFRTNRINPNAPCFLEESAYKILYFLAYLRYDVKKILVRSRYLYIDKNLNSSIRDLLQIPMEGFGFFEPALTCFSILDYLGKISFSTATIQSSEVKSSLYLILETMGGGYKYYASMLYDLHRNGLSHGLRPKGKDWGYTYNTRDGFKAPFEDNNNKLMINIPHLIDSSITQLESICDELLYDQTISEKLLSNYIYFNNKLNNADNKYKQKS